MRQIVINATDARKDFFNLIDRAVKENLEIVIKKSNLDVPVVLKKKTLYEIKKEIDQNLKLADESRSSIKTTGYQADEDEIAKEKFIKKYKEKHGKQ